MSILRTAGLVPSGSAVLVLLLLGACGGGGGPVDDDDDAPAVDVASGGGPAAPSPDPVAGTDRPVDDPVAAPLVGRWETDCDLSPGTGVFGAASLSFGDDGAGTGSVVYADRGCSDALLQFELPASMVTGDRIVLEDGTEANALDIVTGGRVLTTVRDARFAAQANAERFCGRADWAADVTVDLAGCDDIAAFGAVLGSTAFQAFAIESGVLYLGDPFSAPGLSPLNGRVTRLERDRPFSLVAGR